MNWSFSQGRLEQDMQTAEHGVPCSYMRLMLYVTGILVPVLLTVFAWHSGRMSSVEQKTEKAAHELVELRTVLRHHTEVLHEIRADMKEIRDKK